MSFSRLEVVVDSESDDRGILGMDQSTPAGPIKTTVRVMVAAQGVPDERLREIVSWAREHSPSTTRWVESSRLTTVEVSQG